MAQVHLYAFGLKPPTWASTAFQEYSKRLPDAHGIQLHALKPAQGGTAQQRKQKEATQLERLIPAQALRIALDEHGQRWSSVQLAQRWQNWHEQHKQLALIIGGDDGLDADFLRSCPQHWSLSPLTLPHMMVRVVLAEQLYRAWSIQQGHPYHRA